MTKLMRLPILLLLLSALLSGLWFGLARLPWTLPQGQLASPAVHGPLMVSGFLGALISLERAVALDRRWAFGAPLLSLAGAAALVAGLPEPAGPVLMTLGSLGMVAIAAFILRRQLALYTVTMGLGAFCWLAGNGLWLAGRPVAEVVSWWAGFLILTIVGERLELSRVTRLPSHSQYIYGAAVGLTLIGFVLSIFTLAGGVRIASLGFLALALWLARYDVARRTVRKTGQLRYIAANLLVGYLWLAAGGLLGLFHAGATAGTAYDARIHTLFLGFVFSMIFAHAPIILPALTGLSLAFHPILYGPPTLMHLALLTRVGGELAGWMDGRRWGGLFNVVAILWFLGQMIVLVVLTRRRAGAHEPGIQAESTLS